MQHAIENSLIGFRILMQCRERNILIHVKKLVRVKQ